MKPWLRSSDPHARFRLFCFPYAGGGSAEFAGWRDCLPPSVSVCPVVLPGRENRLSESGYTQMGTLARDLARDLLPLFRSAPFALFGHSMGSWIALELARELQRTHRPAPAHLFLSARRAPTVAGTLPPLYHLPDAALIQGIQERYDAIPAQLLAQPELMALFLPGIRADFTLIDTHVHTPGPKLRAPIDAYTGADDPHTSRTDLEPYRELTTGPVRIRTLPGGHFFLRDSRDLLTSAIGGALRPHL